MKCTISQDNLIKIIEWIFFIGFSILAGIFAFGVLQQFFLQKTSFSQLEETVNDYPVVTIILLGHKASEVNQSNVIIRYWVSGMEFPSLFKLDIGPNHIHNDQYNITENVILESLEDSYGQRLYRIIHTTPILNMEFPMVHILMHTKFEDNPQIGGPQPLFSNVNVFFLTSRKNSPGFFDGGISIDGKPMIITIDKNTSVIYNIQPQITKYIKELGKCQEEPYYDCISSQIDNTEFKECPKKCIPDVFSIMDKNYSTPFCQDDTSNQKCVANQMLAKDFGSKCKKSCSKLEYYGELDGFLPNRIIKHKNWNGYMVNYVLINNNRDAKVYEEYLIYDTIGMIGSVGGTLGMFIN